MTAIERWRSALAGWAIPQRILDAAPESPWHHSPRSFAARADNAMRAAHPGPSARHAAEALPDGGSVLDVGCGAGAASLPLLARASRLVAVDTDAPMLEALRERVPAGCELVVIEGRWPDVAGDAPDVDVVVCSHVAYNIPDLDDAVLRMTERARHRVVVELTREHPRSGLNFLWPLLHGIEMPDRPVAADAVAVVRECGMDPGVEEWLSGDLSLGSADLAELVASVRRSLCLDASRDPDIARALEDHLERRDGQIGLPPRALVCVWWDTSRAAGATPGQNRRMTFNDPRSDLHRYLQTARETMLWKLEGLAEFDARRPLTPTGTNLLGLVKHLATVEIGYFGDCFGRPFEEALPWTDEAAEAGDDMWARPDETRAQIVDLYRRAWSHADQTIQATPLEAVGTVPWWPEDRRDATLHRLLVHMIAETNRHAGHADILRELIDGAVGHRREVSNMAPGDAAAWSAFRDRLEQAAKAAT